MKRFLLPLLVIVFSSAGLLSALASEPVNPDATEEARALLEFHYDISGKYFLTGQHNYPDKGDRNSQFAADYTGKAPVIFSADWGFSDEGDKDSYLARPKIVAEAIRQHNKGAIITICWHAVPPTADEPITFQPLPGADPNALASVQGHMTEEQYRDLMTPGTDIYKKWASQVDNIAGYLKQLQDAGVPVLWRPYHEMNGSWFWWGGRTEEYSTAQLWRQLFDRMVNHHHLNNLVWVWNVDRVSQPNMEHEKYFPGIEYVDILSLDVYRNDFAKSYYDSLVTLSEGKPLLFGEVGNAPALEILDAQPLWTSYVIWAGMVSNTAKEEYAKLMADPRFLGLHDKAYQEAAAKLHATFGVTLESGSTKSLDLSGFWMLDEEASEFGRFGRGGSSARMEIEHEGNSLSITRIQTSEYDDPTETTESLTIGGEVVKSTFRNAPRTTSISLSEDGQNVVMKSETVFGQGEAGFKVDSTETWTLNDDGQSLVVNQSSVSPRGENVSKLVYQKWK